MWQKNLQIHLFDLVTSITRVVDIMSPAVGGHHLQVAYLAYRIAEALGLSADQKNELLMAGALHDIGAFSLKDRLDLLEFEDIQPGKHAIAGYLLLREFKPFASLARLIKYHHVPWQNGRGSMKNGEAVPRGSHILHLADRVSVLFSKASPVLSQVEAVCEIINKGRNTVFIAEQVDALLHLAQKDFIWLDLTSDFLEAVLRRNFFNQYAEIHVKSMRSFSQLISRLIDFKSKYTATHSSGVAASAVAMAKMAGFSAQERRLVEIAAYLHDLGKLAIPSEILEKKNKLSNQEWFIMRAHVYYTHQILAPFKTLGVVNAWGALHQERLNGSGYPFGYQEDALPLGARLMAVADVFTALTENRPYRKGMGKADTLDVLCLMVDNGELDQRMVELVAAKFNQMNQIRNVAQQTASASYGEFRLSFE